MIKDLLIMVIFFYLRCTFLILFSNIMHLCSSLKMEDDRLLKYKERFLMTKHLLVQDHTDLLWSFKERHSKVIRKLLLDSIYLYTYLKVQNRLILFFCYYQVTYFKVWHLYGKFSIYANRSMRIRFDENNEKLLTNSF